MRLGLLRKNTCELGYETCLGLLDLHDLWLTLGDVLLCVLDLSLQHPNHTVQLANLIVILSTMYTVRLHIYVLASIMQGQRNHETQQDTKRRECFLKKWSVMYLLCPLWWLHPSYDRTCPTFCKHFPFPATRHKQLHV